MARYDVSTWAQFVQAWRDTVGGDIIEVSADLDVNDDIPAAQINDHEGAGSGIVTINGNNHTLYNLSGGSPYAGVIFDSTWQQHNFNNLNLQNMDLSRPAFLGYSTATRVVFAGCNIQGRASGNPFFSGYVSFDRCTCTFTNTNSVITQDQASFLNCWIWLRNCRKTWGGSGAALIRHLNTCYIKGDVTYGSDTSSIVSDAVEDVQNCCFNVSINAGYDGFSADYYCYNASGKLTIINIDKLPSGTRPSADVQAIAVTDEQMRDANYLFSIGFDIVPSE